MFYLLAFTQLIHDTNTLHFLYLLWFADESLMEFIVTQLLLSPFIDLFHNCLLLAGYYIYYDDMFYSDILLIAS